MRHHYLPVNLLRRSQKTLRSTQPTLSVIVKGDLELLVKNPDGQESTAFLDNAYSQYKMNPKEIDNVLRIYITSFIETRTTSNIIDHVRIVPIIKDRAWPAEFRETINQRNPTKQIAGNVYDEFNSDLVVVYAEDTPNNIRYLSRKKGTDLFFCSCRLGLEIRRALSLGLGRDMPRRGTGVLQQFPHHVVQRGHNKQVVFAEEVDFLYYLSTLEAYKEIYGVKVYGFCLMTNHVRLILQPGDAVAGMGRLMKRLAGRQTRFVNRQELRTGTLWESRYRSSPIETEACWLACRYVELNPVRAGMVGDPSEYPWSSFHRHAGGGGRFAWVDMDPCYLGLGATDEERAARYRDFFDFFHSAVGAGELSLIREALQRG